MEKLGEKIKNARENLGMSQKALADSLGVQTQTVWRWEKGEREPSWDIIQSIANLLNAPQLTEAVNELGQNKINKSIHLGLSYWGSVVDNAKEIAERGNLSDISLIEILLKSACEILNFKKQEIIKNNTMTNNNENKINSTSTSANVDIHHNDMKGTNFNFANTTNNNN